MHLPNHQWYIGYNRNRLRSPVKYWAPWMQTISPTLRPSSEPLHCTLHYDKNQTDEEYDELWNCVNQRQYMVRCNDIYIGAQGAALSAKSPPDVSPWFQVPNSVPHLTLAVADGRISDEMGPRINKPSHAKNGFPLLMHSYIDPRMYSLLESLQQQWT